MFHEMRRKERILTNEEAETILNKAEYGVFSTIGEDGYPYGVPVNYVFYNGNIYFHCASNVGHKLENIKYNPNISFTVVTDSTIIPSGLTTGYSSVIIFGKASFAEGEEAKAALLKLVEKLAPDFVEKGKSCIESGKMPASVIKITPEYITGKANK